MTALDGTLARRGEDISARARQVQFSRVMLLLFTGVFFAAGWTAAKLFGVIWFAVVWVAMATAEGWQSGRPPKEKSP